MRSATTHFMKSKFDESSSYCVPYLISRICEWQNNQKKQNRSNIKQFWVKRHSYLKHWIPWNDQMITHDSWNTKHDSNNKTNLRGKKTELEMKANKQQQLNRQIVTKLIYYTGKINKRQILEKENRKETETERERERERERQRRLAMVLTMALFLSVSRSMSMRLSAGFCNGNKHNAMTDVQLWD